MSRPFASTSSWALLGTITVFGVLGMAASTYQRVQLAERPTQTRAAFSTPVEPEPEPEPHLPAIVSFGEQLYVGVVVWHVPQGTKDTRDLRWRSANTAARHLLPHMATAHRGSSPYDLFPTMDTEEGRAFWGFLVKAAEAQVAMPIGATEYEGIPWFSSLAPIDKEHVAVVFQPLGDLSERDPEQGYHFSRDEKVQAQLTYIEKVIDAVEQRVESVDTGD